jgi:hypothetical protein
LILELHWLLPFTVLRCDEVESVTFQSGEWRVVSDEEWHPHPPYLKNASVANKGVTVNFYASVHCARLEVAVFSTKNQTSCLEFVSVYSKGVTLRECVGVASIVVSVILIPVQARAKAFAAELASSINSTY